jgi:tetratricopeptide (TPR) repeat protein
MPMRRDAINRLKTALAAIGLTALEIDDLQLDRFVQVNPTTQQALVQTIGRAVPRREPPFRDEAAATLLEAYEACPTSSIPLEAAIRQTQSPGEAEAIARILVDAHPRPRSYSLAASVLERQERWADAIALVRRIVDADPNGLGPRLRLADLLWQNGETAAAVEAYRATLERDANFELDPLKRLSDRDRARVIGRSQGP